jgi:hypothetical protein
LRVRHECESGFSGTADDRGMAFFRSQYGHIAVFHPAGCLEIAAQSVAPLHQKLNVFMDSKMQLAAEIDQLLGEGN